MDLFRPSRTGTYAEDVRRFVAAVPAAAPGALLDEPVPVLDADRPDLTASRALAADLYTGVRRPPPLPVGVVLGDVPAAVLELARPLAASWRPDLSTVDGPVLVVARYDALCLDPVRDLLLSTADPAFLVGRDVPSLAWFVAKQYLAGDGGAVGLFTDTDRPPAPEGTMVFTDRDFEHGDIVKEIRGRHWRRVTFQGHGKDDNLNLGEFTLCGRNETAAAVPGMLAPRCAYGHPCFKPEDKLVPLNQVPAVEIVLSACNSGPLADLALYDPKYQLLLNAIDGAARTVVSAVSVHDSDRPENVAWLAVAGRTGADSVTLLNSSLADAHPYPAFLRFGLPGEPVTAPPTVPPDPLYLRAGERVAALLGGELLAPGHPLRPRFSRLSRKIDLRLARPTQAAAEGEAAAHGTLLADLQSIDYAIASLLAADPEDDLLNYPAYFGDRSRLDPSTVDTVRCTCGRPAQRYLRRGLLSRILDTECVICLRCGDTVFRLPDGPVLAGDAPDLVPAGTTTEVRMRVSGRAGPAQIGLFVPRYLRADCAVVPEVTRVRLRDGEERELTVRLEVAASAVPQAYYFTAYAVQDLAISTLRRHFGIVPSDTTQEQP
jgi:hypothetical protein